MDTVTQITLGAAVGEAVLGKRIGNRAALYGAVFGVLPDIDVLASPFISDVTALAVHRGITHSLLLSVTASLLFGWLMERYTGEKRVGWRFWSRMIFLVYFTHILIDLCTSYGTQIFQPFSNYSLSFNSIFIIDPFFTLPMAAGILLSLFYNRTSRKRRAFNTAGLVVSTLYLVCGFMVKAHVNSVFDRNFKAENIQPERYMSTPAPFTIFLWVGYAEEGDTLYAGLYSVFDRNKEITFHTVPQKAGKLAPYREDLPVERIIWFSRGYYVVSETDSALLVHDLRFGRSDLWLEEGPAPYVWNYKLQFNDDSTGVTGFDRFEPELNLRMRMPGKLVRRISGRK